MACAHQLVMEDLVLTQRETPCAGLPHWSGKLRSQVMPHTPALHERVPRALLSLGQVVLQAPQKLGSVWRLAQKGPEFVAHACTGGLGLVHVTVHTPAFGAQKYLSLSASGECFVSCASGGMRMLIMPEENAPSHCACSLSADAWQGNSEGCRHH